MMIRTNKWYRWPIWDMDRGKLTTFHLFWSEDGEKPKVPQETLCGRRVMLKVGHGSYSPAYKRPDWMESEDAPEHLRCKTCQRRLEGMAK